MTDPSERRSEAIRVARRLEGWASSRDWRGTDPYDGLNGRRVPRTLRKSPIGLRILTQVVKRSPLDLRPMLGIPPGLSSATLALAISAYARNGFMPEPDARLRLDAAIQQLRSMCLPGYRGACWGYHFDVQTRVFFYPSTTPNTIATAFAGLALLDAYELAGRADALELALAAAEFFVTHVPQTEGSLGAHFGYLPDDTTPIHNASMLICALLARLASLTGRDDLRTAATAGLQYTVGHQRDDGSWPYGELPHLAWVDGFHTGYVLDCLLTCVQAGLGGPVAAEAWRRGLAYYVRSLVEPSGLPRYAPESRYPVDGQCAAQAIETLSRAAPLEPGLADRRWAVFAYSMRRLARSDGAFAFQRERLWFNRAAHPRWVQAPLLKALTVLIKS